MQQLPALTLRDERDETGAPMLVASFGGKEHCFTGAMALKLRASVASMLEALEKHRLSR